MPNLCIKLPIFDLVLCFSDFKSLVLVIVRTYCACG